MEILGIINSVIIYVVAVAFAFQLIYLFLFFLKPKKYARAEKKHKIAVIICAHNEADTIRRTLNNIFLQDYPQGDYRVFVFADNCTDDTAAIARECGAEVYERTDTDKKRQGACYALRFGIERVLKDYPEVEAFVKFDADDIPKKDYISRMNDAFDAGVQLARGYNHANNLTQNVVSGVSGLWYIRDCRFNCNARSALGIGQMLVGGGMMFAADIMREQGGWTAMGMSEDAQFTIEQLYKKRKAQYVADAVVYEDQPSSVGQLFKRNMRMGRGLMKLFFTDGIQCLGRFLISFRYTFLDMFLTLLFIPIALLCCAWFPAYYVGTTIYMGVTGDIAAMTEQLYFIGLILVVAFILPFIAQAFLVYFLDRKKIGVKFSKILPSILLFPLFMIVYALGITAGAICRAKWLSVGRSRYYDEAFRDSYKAEHGVEFDILDALPAPAPPAAALAAVAATVDESADITDAESAVDKNADLTDAQGVSGRAEAVEVTDPVDASGAATPETSDGPGE